MNDDRCPQETHVLHAAEQNDWKPALRAHVADCADCAAAANVGPWMKRFAKIDARQHILPDPAIVWLKAQLLRTATAVERVSRPLNIVSMIAYLVVAAGWAAILTWKWSALQTWLSSLTTARFFVAEGALSLPFFMIVFVLSTLTVMVALHTILADEG